MSLNVRLAFHAEGKFFAEQMESLAKRAGLDEAGEGGQAQGEKFSAAMMDLLGASGASGMKG